MSAVVKRLKLRESFDCQPTADAENGQQILTYPIAFQTAREGLVTTREEINEQFSRHSTSLISIISTSSKTGHK